MAHEGSDRKEQGEPAGGDELLASQIAYYRAHAPRYDDWWLRHGRHDLGEAYRQSWTDEIETLRSWLAAVGRLGDVLELAGGTGNWTRELAGMASTVTVVDASPEAVAIARDKVSGNVTWVIEDIFGFRPDRRFDTVFFSFWLSHVPEERFAGFWELVGRCLEPGGRVFFIDNADPELARTVKPEFFDVGRWHRDETTIGGIDSVTNLTTGVASRVAADGRSYELIKIWRQPEELRTQLAALGWDFEVATTEWAFLYGSGSNHRSRRRRTSNGVLTRAPRGQVGPPRRGPPDRPAGGPPHPGPSQDRSVAAGVVWRRYAPPPLM